MLSFSSCHRKNVPGGSAVNGNIVSNQPVQWLYITIGSTMDSTKNLPAFRVLQQQVTDGKTIKKENGNGPAPGDWKVNIIDAKGHVLDFAIIANPHFRSMEYEDKNGQLSTKQVYTAYVEIPFKFTYTAAAKQIEILEIEGNKKQKKMFTASLAF